MSEHPPAWQAWQLDTIDDGKPKPRLPLKKSPIPNGMKMPTAAELEQVHQDIHAEARRQATNAAIESVKQRLYDLQTIELDPEAEPAVARAITELRDYQYHL